MHGEHEVACPLGIVAQVKAGTFHRLSALRKLAQTAPGRINIARVTQSARQIAGRAGNQERFAGRCIAVQLVLLFQQPDGYAAI